LTLFAMKDCTFEASVQIDKKY